MFISLKQKWKKAKQERNVRSEDVKKRLLEDGQDIFKEFKIKKVILFGSVRDNRMGAASDVAILFNLIGSEKKRSQKNIRKSGNV